MLKTKKEAGNAIRLMESIKLVKSSFGAVGAPVVFAGVRADGCEAAVDLIGVFSTNGIRTDGDA